MASQAEISAVKVQLPDDPATYGITDDVINSQLSITTQTKTILFCLRGIAAKVAPVESISESGSSRTMNFHNNLMQQIADWQKRADAEDRQDGTLPPKGHGFSRTAVRV